MKSNKNETKADTILKYVMYGLIIIVIGFIILSALGVIKI